MNKFDYYNFKKRIYKKGIKNSLEKKLIFSLEFLETKMYISYKKNRVA